MMKRIGWLAAPTLALGLVGCGDDSGLTGDDGPEPDAAQVDAPPGVTIVDVPAGDIAVDTMWTKDHIYVLKGYVFMTGGTLTIQAGTTVRGDNGSALTITKDAKINAVGTASEPIVFTSSATMPESGDWGGLVMLGRATINVAGGANGIEGFASSFGERVRYGGTDNAHDCGDLKYARIEYAGFELATNVELNGLTIGGCGSATEVDYVQVHLGLDDGVEMFGGTTNLKHILITQPDDDGLDWDFGWSGKVQFLIVQQKLGRGDKGIEADNNVNDLGAAPRSQPDIWNATLIGGDGPQATKKQGGMHMRRGTAGKISNAIVAYWNTFGVDVDGLDSVGQYGTNLSISHTYFVPASTETAVWTTNFDANTSGVQNDCQTGGVNCFDEATTIGGAATNHVGVNVMLPADAKNVTAPNLKPAAGSPVLTGCGTPPAGLDQTATFCGAIGATDWTTGWTRYPM